MNDKQADAMLKSLKRIESLMEAVDWKLWNLHQRVMGESATEETPSVEEEETEQLAAIIEPKKPAEPVEKKSGFPSVEKWS